MRLVGFIHSTLTDFTCDTSLHTCVYEGAAHTNNDRPSSFAESLSRNAGPFRSLLLLSVEYMSLCRLESMAQRCICHRVGCLYRLPRRWMRLFKGVGSARRDKRDKMPIGKLKIGH